MTFICQNGLNCAHFDHIHCVLMCVILLTIHDLIILYTNTSATAERPRVYLDDSVGLGLF